MLPRILSRVISWANAHHLYNLDVDERGVALWEKDTFHRVAVAVTDRFSIDATHHFSVTWSVVAAVGGSASFVAASGGSHVLTDTYGEYLGSGYSHELVEYPAFDLHLLKRCLQKVSSSVFGSLDPFSMTEFLSRVWMGQSIATGWCYVTVFAVPSFQKSGQCCRFLSSSATLWECGPSSWSTLRRRGERPMATA